MKKLLLLLLPVLAFIFPSCAQPGAISGTIRNAAGQPATQASVSITQKGISRGAVITGIDGKYTIAHLAAGRYDVHVNLTGHDRLNVKDVIIQRGRTTTLDLSLQPVQGGVQKEVVMQYAPPPVAEKKKALNAVSLKDEEASAVEYDMVSSGKAAGTVASYSYAPAPQAAAPPSGVYYNPSTEEYKKQQENDFMTVKASPLSTMSVDVDHASYSNVRRFINEGTMPPPDAVRVEEMVNYFRYYYPQPKAEDPIAIVTETTTCPWNPEHRILHIGMQARAVKTDNLPPSNITFLIDVSGSMDEPDKLPLLKAAFMLLTDELRAQDRVSIVVYAGNAGLVLPPTPGNEKNKIRRALDKLEAGGSTAGGEGIQLAYNVAKENFVKGGNNRVILATDGDFNVGISNDNELEELITKEREKGIFLSCLGVGQGNYKDAKMEMMADKGNGNYNYIDNLKEAQKTLVSEFGSTLFTVAKDVKAQIEFNPEMVKGYRLVGYENRVLNAEDFKDDKKDAGDMGSGHSVTILYEIIPAGATSDRARNVDPLKYQHANTSAAALNGELATIKFRYKAPDGNKSREMVHTISGNVKDISEATADTRFSESVALFGMLLHQSKFKGTGNYETVLSLAKEGLGNDEEGYRAEFLKMVKRVEGFAVVK
ncbi:YfbK domain-containing protein [Chitinophagaceae bacterium MMS25-I14]